MEALLRERSLLKGYLSYDKPTELWGIWIAKSSSLECRRKVKKYRNGEFIGKDEEPYEQGGDNREARQKNVQSAT